MGQGKNIVALGPEHEILFLSVFNEFSGQGESRYLRDAKSADTLHQQIVQAEGNQTLSVSFRFSSTTPLVGGVLTCGDTTSLFSPVDMSKVDSGLTNKAREMLLQMGGCPG
jgi:hypothetical protein